jgi:hypothetical protein
MSKVSLKIPVGDLTEEAALSKARKPEKPKFASLKEAGLESFVVVEMDRAQLTAATYNPRKITDQERDKLKAALKKHGLVAPVIWNKKTGNLVGGHQRINIMDSLMGSQQYTLQVSVIDVDQKKEKEINVLLNNSQAMGSFDLALLKDVFADGEVDIIGAGFNQQDMMQMFGTGVFDSRAKDLAEFTAHLAKIHDEYDAVAAANQKREGGENYLVFVFPSSAHVDELIKSQGWEENRYQNGTALLDKYGCVVDAPKNN